MSTGCSGFKVTDDLDKRGSFSRQVGHILEVKGGGDGPKQQVVPPRDAPTTPVADLAHMQTWVSMSGANHRLVANSHPASLTDHPQGHEVINLVMNHH